MNVFYKILKVLFNRENLSERNRKEKSLKKTLQNKSFRTRTFREREKNGRTKMRTGRSETPERQLQNSFIESISNRVLQMCGREVGMLMLLRRLKFMSLSLR